MDRLDEINLLNYYKRNIVKWWDIKTIDPEDMFVIGDPDADYYDKLCLVDNNNDIDNDNEYSEDALPDLNVLDEDSQQVAMNVLSRNDDTAFEDALMKQKEEEANAIFERLMAEAAFDEAKKQAEIEAAKLGQIV